jgi:hypothetical protein
MIIQDGKLFCDICEEQIVLAGKHPTQVLLELVKGGTDRIVIIARTAYQRRRIVPVGQHMPIATNEPSTTLAN